MKKKIVIMVLMIATFVVCYPVIFLITGSFMSGGEIADNIGAIMSQDFGGFAKWSLLPMYPTIKSYVEILLDEPEFFVLFWNSIKIVGGVIAGQLIIGVSAAWGFAKYEFPMRRIIFSMYIVFMMLPFQVIMLSEYLVLNELNLLNTLWSIILPGIFSTFSVFIIYNFFKGIPEAIMESARIDGANEFQVFIYIGVPLAMPGIAAAMILQFLEYWNVIEQPMIFLKEQHLWPLSLYLPNIRLDNAGIAFASSIIALIPAFLVFYAGRINLEKGIAASAVKE